MTLNFQTTKNLGIQGFNKFITLLNDGKVKTGFMNLGRRDLNWEDTTGAKLNLIFAAGCDLQNILTARIENARTQAEETWFTKKNDKLEDMLRASCIVAESTLDQYSDFEYDEYTNATTSFFTEQLELDSNSYEYTQVYTRVAYEVARDTLIGTLKSSGFGDEAKAVSQIVTFFNELITEICEKDDNIANASATRQTVATAPATNSLQDIFNSL